MFTRLVLLFFATTLVLSPIMAQTTAPARDPRALNLIASSLNALSGSVSVNDATLQATAAYVAGSDQESGGAILIGHVNQESIVQLNLSGGTRQEIRNGIAGAWSAPDATVHSMAAHNCWTDASWFFPALTLQTTSADPTLALSYFGSDSSSGSPLLHLRVARVLSADTAAAASEILRLSPTFAVEGVEERQVVCF